MATANRRQPPTGPSGEPDTTGETVRERLQRMRTGAKEPPPEREEPATRPPRVTRKEPGRRAREQERTAAVREPSPPAAGRRRATVREPGPAAAEPPPAPPAAGARTEEGEGGAPAEPAEVVSERLAARLAALRSERGWSLQDLSRRTGVSRSNLSRIERGEISPTADVLVRLAAAYDQTLSGLMAEVESQPRSLVRAAEQAVTGEDVWRRRVVSPPYPGLAGSITDAQLLPGGDVTYEPPQPGAEQHLWLITGSLEVTLSTPSPSAPASSAGGSDDDPEVRAEKEGDFVLIRGDCLRLRLWGPARLRCLSPEPARYALFTVMPAPAP
jgi:transcriptional regulator with XRE-family HTH domain